MHRIASLTGTVLKALFSGLVRLRHPRPVHPHGVALTGEMRWLGPSASGIAWVDEPPSEPSALAAALRETPWRLRLHVAAPTGRWHPFAELTLRHETGALDTSERIDVGAHVPPGATVASWIHAIRDPSYREVQTRTSGTPSERPQPDG